MRYTKCSRAVKALGTLLIASNIQAQVPFGLGEFEWVQRFGGDHGAYSCAYDPWGSIFITGYTMDSVNFTDTTFHCPDYLDFFLVKFDSAGEYLWGLQGNATYSALSRKLVVDSQGNAVVGVMMSSDIVIQGDTIHKSPAYIDMLVLKFDPWGQLLWYAQSWSPDGGPALRGIALDDEDNVLMICQTVGPSVVFGHDTITPLWNQMLNIVKYDSDGNHVWTNRIDEEYNPSMAVEEITTDQWGNIYTFCRTYGNTDFGGQFSFTGPNEARLTLVKLTPDGQFAWVRRITDQGFLNNPVGIATQGDKVYITGTTYRAIPLGPYHYADSALIDGRFVAFLAQYDTAGIFQWNRYGYHGAITAGSIVVGDDGLITTLGGGTGAITFPDTVLTGWNAGTYQMQYNEQGDRLDLRRTGSSDHKNGARALAVWQDKLMVYGIWTDSSYFPTDTAVAYIQDPAVNGFLYQVGGIHLPTSIAEPSVPTNLHSVLYPNPAQQSASIRYMLFESGNVELRLTDAAGRIVQHERLGSKPVGEHVFQFNLEALADGLYLIHLNTPEGHAVHKVLKSR